MNRLTQLLAIGAATSILAGTAKPSMAYECEIVDDYFVAGITTYRDTTLYKRWRENQGLPEFTGDFTDAQDADAHPDARRYWVVNGHSTNRIDSVKLWLKDADGNLLAEVNRGINIPYEDAAKFQIPWKDGYQLDLRITWVKYGAKKTWTDIWGDDKGGGVEDSGIKVRSNSDQAPTKYSFQRLENCG